MKKKKKRSNKHIAKFLKYRMENQGAMENLKLIQKFTNYKEYKKRSHGFKEMAKMYEEQIND